MLRAFDCSFDLWRLHMSLIFWFNHHSRSRSASHLWLCLEIIIIFMVSRDNLLLNLWLCHTSFKGNPTGPISKWQMQNFLILLARQCILVISVISDSCNWDLCLPFSWQYKRILCAAVIVKYLGPSLFGYLSGWKEEYHNWHELCTCLVTFFLKPDLIW